MNTILVTGGAGFIGSHLCERLLNMEYSVVNVDNFSESYDPLIKRSNISAAKLNPKYVLIEGDIRNKHLMESIFKGFNIDTVVHLASTGGGRKSTEFALDSTDMEIKGLVNLLESSKKFRLRKFIYASSSSVYGSNPVPLKEDILLDSQISTFGAAKRSGELFCKVYNNLYGIPVICLRMFTVYGPRQRPDMAIHNFSVLMDEGRELSIFGDGKSTRDYIYIDDIVDGIISSIDYKCGFEIINLGSSTAISLNNLINILEDKLEKLALKRYLKSQPSEMEHTCADISKAKSLISFIPRVEIEAGIDKFIEWYRAKKLIIADKY